MLDTAVTPKQVLQVLKKGFLLIVVTNDISLRNRVFPPGEDGKSFPVATRMLADSSHQEKFSLSRLFALILIWVGFLGVRFEVGGIKLPPPPSKIMLAT